MQQWVFSIDVKVVSHYHQKPAGERGQGSYWTPEGVAWPLGEKQPVKANSRSAGGINTCPQFPTAFEFPASTLF